LNFDLEPQLAKQRIHEHPRRQGHDHEALDLRATLLRLERGPTSPGWRDPRT